MTDNTRTTVRVEELRELVADALELPVEEVTDEARFVEDLEMDSLIALEIAVKLEQRYGIKMSDEELKNVGSFPDVRALVADRIGDGLVP